MKKILFVAPNLEHGGAESVLVKIINNIDLKKYEVKLALLQKRGSHLSKLKKDIEILDLNAKGPIESILELKKVIRHEKPTTVFSIIGHVNIYMAILKVLFFKDIKFIARENVVYSEWLYKDRNIKKIVLGMLYSIYLKRLDVIMVQSNFMAEQIMRYFNVPKYKIAVFNNPLEHSKIDELQKQELNDNRWDFDKINLIAVGRIEKVKNYEGMIDIVKILPDKFHLNILGDGKEKKNLEEYIAKNSVKDKVTLYGYVDNPYKYMRNSFALLLTSHRESYPNVVLEANACGIYAVSYEMPGGITEIISLDFANGELIPFGLKDKFNKAITLLDKNGYDKLLIQNYASQFSIKDYMNKLYKIID
jgi:glycosyltransferase involved in cell wall biosynthesis